MALGHVQGCITALPYVIAGTNTLEGTLGVPTGVALAFSPTWWEIYPEYIADANIAICPSNIRHDSTQLKYASAWPPANASAGDSCVGLHDARRQKLRLPGRPH